MKYRNFLSGYAFQFKQVIAIGLYCISNFFKPYQDEFTRIENECFVLRLESINQNSFTSFLYFLWKKGKEVCSIFN